MAHESNAPPTSDIEQRIERVINDLRPETAFTHQYGPKAPLQERMAFFHTPGVSIAVINNYEIEWARGFGVKAWGKPDPVTETTVFQAASISKPIFALAVMRLVQEGKLNFDEDVNRYLTSWKVTANGAWQPRVTLRQLLSHFGGLTVHGFPGYLATEKMPTVVDILNGQSPSKTARIEVNILPGLQCRYSGGGITVAQQLVADVLGQPFPKIMQSLVLEPLGMEHSTYEQPLSERWVGSAATAHTWKNKAVEGQWHVYPEMGAAGLWTTPSDLARAGLELQQTLKRESKRLLSTEMVVQMLTPGIDESIGIGFFLSGKDRAIRFGHDGWNEGFVAQMTVYKEHGMGAVIMLNSNEGFPMMNEIERAIAREYDWPGYFPQEKTTEVASQILETYAGTYEGPCGVRCTITRQDDRLIMAVADQAAIELHAESQTKFLMKILNTEVTFDKTDEGEVKSLTIHQAGGQTVCERK